ncbi:hypothetical protein LH47_02526 [Anoxybacillus thermarum]|uniref:Uncharacterized protein n=1 Tax=Anoxybacillus thermarum TaxID=404937 RepID=A0A0D0RNM7_9BACL|nr:hypothetical protein LH47_02526 [Anoxybacillus thermarum]
MRKHGDKVEVSFNVQLPINVCSKCHVEFILLYVADHCNEIWEQGVSQDFVENIFSVHYGCCQSLVSEPFSGIDIVSAFGLSSLILK